MFIVEKSFRAILLSTLVVGASACFTTDATRGVTKGTTNVASSTTPSDSSAAAGDRVRKLRKFAKYNFMDLQRDFAQGRGEYLTSLETLLGVPSKSHEEFASFAQANYESFFGSKHRTSDQVLAGLAPFGSEDIRHALLFQLAANCSVSAQVRQLKEDC